MRISDWSSDVCSSDLVLKAARRTSVAFSDEDEMLSTFTASGISVPLVEARIVDELMNPLPHDGRTPAELVLRAPWLTSASAGDAKTSEATSEERRVWKDGVSISSCRCATVY